MTAPATRRRSIAMLTHSYYEEDARVRREAESLVRSGRSVSVISLRAAGAAPREWVRGVDVHRLPVRRHQGAGLATYLVEYASFAARASIALMRLHRRRRLGLVQVHSIPDFLAFAAIPTKVAGIPLLLDLHEAMPEFFRTRFSRRLPGPTVRLAMVALRLQERASIAFADAVITVNDALGERLRRLGVSPAKLTIIANSPSLEMFDAQAHPVRAFGEDGVVRLVYAGSLSPTYEIDVAIRAVAVIRGQRPDLAVRLDLYGRDFGEVPLRALVSELSLDEAVRFHGRIPLEAVPGAIAAADIGLAPTRRSRFTDYSLSTKVFEYAAMGKPVVASRLPMIERTFGTDAVASYTPGEPRDLARAIFRLVDDPPTRISLVESAASIVRDRSWDRLGSRYVELVDALIADS